MTGLFPTVSRLRKKNSPSRNIAMYLLFNGLPGIVSPLQGLFQLLQILRIWNIDSGKLSSNFSFDPKVMGQINPITVNLGGFVSYTTYFLYNLYATWEDINAINGVTTGCA
ncbi:MAG: hypothetical protein M1581_01410 [Candidatus Thermoplasmatota archaeon]|nr:hypothetical protein [Candidatus Thermoplasmatota archaeon]